MKTNRILLLSALISASFAISASAATQYSGIVTADVLNVRSKPTTESAILSQLPNGSAVTVTEITDNNWYKINVGETSAYVSADYVQLGGASWVPDGKPTLSVTPTANASAVPSAAAETASSTEKKTTVAIPENAPEIPSYQGSLVLGEQLVERAKQFIGTPYVYGGMSPDGFDCSGFVKYCCNLVGIEIDRVSTDQALCGTEVSASEMKPGDILCFASSVGSDYIGHTGIYVGNGYFIHSPRTGYSVEIVPLGGTSYGERLATVRRMF